MTKVLNVSLVATRTVVVIQLIPAPVFVDCNNFNVMDFTGFFLIGPFCHINAATGRGVIGASY